MAMATGMGMAMVMVMLMAMRMLSVCSVLLLLLLCLAVWVSDGEWQRGDSESAQGGEALPTKRGRNGFAPKWETLGRPNTFAPQSSPAPSYPLPMLYYFISTLLALF